MMEPRPSDESPAVSADAGRIESDPVGVHEADPKVVRAGPGRVRPNRTEIPDRMSAAGSGVDAEALDDLAASPVRAQTARSPS
jgi:hypothetical protein